MTHVRDRYGVVWRHDGDRLWWGDLGHGFEQHRTWWELLSRGELVDVTGAVG